MKRSLTDIIFVIVVSFVIVVAVVVAVVADVVVVVQLDRTICNAVM